VKWQDKNREASPERLGLPLRVALYARRAPLATRLLAGYFLIRLATVCPVHAQATPDQIGPYLRTFTPAGSTQSVTLSQPQGVAIDNQGTLYIADTQNCVIWKFPNNGAPSILAGQLGDCNYTSSNPALSQLHYPLDVAFCNGTVFIADTSTATNIGLHKIANGVFSDIPLTYSTTADAAGLVQPEAIACDSAGNLFVQSTFIATETGVPQYTLDVYTTNGVSANIASSYDITFQGVAVDAQGNVYASINSGAGQQSIAKLTSSAFPNGWSESRLALPRYLVSPTRIALDTQGNIYVTEGPATGTSTPTVYVTEISSSSGSYSVAYIAGDGSTSPVTTGLASATSVGLDNVNGLAVDGCGSIYAADTGNNQIVKIFNPLTASQSSCISGSSAGGGSSGAAFTTTALSVSPASQQVTPPQSISFTSDVTVGNCPSCTGPPTGNVTFCVVASATIAGTSSTPCSAGTVMGEVSLTPQTSTTSYANLTVGSSAPNFPIPGTTYQVEALYTDPTEVLPSSNSGSLAITICGVSCTSSGAPTPPPAPAYPVALTPGILREPFLQPGPVAFDAQNNEYFLNAAAGTVTCISQQNLCDGQPSSVVIPNPFTLAGTSTSISLSAASDLTIGSDGNLYLTESGNGHIIKVVGPASATPAISDITPSLSPALSSPMGIFETSEEVYVTDSATNRVVAFRPDGTYPSVLFPLTTQASPPPVGSLLGIAVNPTTLEIYVANAAVSGNGGNILEMSIGGNASVLPMPPGVTLQSPYGLALDPANGLYFSDTGTHQAYRMDVYGNVIVVAGNGSTTELGPGTSATQTGLANPTWLTVDPLNNIWFSDGNFMREVDTSTSLVNFNAIGQERIIYLTSAVSAVQGSAGILLPLALSGLGEGNFMLDSTNSTCPLTAVYSTSISLSPNTSCAIDVILLSAGSDATANIQFTSDIEELTGEFTPSVNPPGLQQQVIQLNGTQAAGTTVLQITPSSLSASPGTVNVAYPTLNFLVTNASPGATLSFGLSMGALPPGMSLSSAGALTGIPTQTGTFTFTISVTDTNGDSGSQSYTLTINPAISINISPGTATVPPGAEIPFAASVIGTSNPVTWSLAPSSCGIINAVGVFTAPLAGPCTATVIASVTAPWGTTATATATVTVTGSAPPPPPVNLTINETIYVDDQMNDWVSLVPLVNITAPVAFFSTDTVGFGSASGTQTVAVSNIGESQTGLQLANAVITPAGTFSLGTISCSNNVNTFATTLPPGGTCLVSITYTAPAAGTPPTATLTFTDNAALSNLPSTPSSGSYTQSISLNGAGTTTSAPPAPQAVIPLTISETITVNDQTQIPTLQSIAVTPVSPTIAEGASEAFTATGTFSDGTTQNLTSAVTWSSSNTNVANMSGNIATACNCLGQAKITATLGSTTGSTELTVLSYLRIQPALTTVTLASNGGYVVKLAVTNNGDTTAANVTAVAAILGTKGMTSSVAATNLAPGATGTVTLVFPASAGVQHTKQLFIAGGIATGTNPNGTPALPAVWVLPAIQVTLP